MARLIGTAASSAKPLVNGVGLGCSSGALRLLPRLVPCPLRSGKVPAVDTVLIPVTPLLCPGCV